MPGRGSIRTQSLISTGVSFNIEGPPFAGLMEWLPRPGEAFTVSAPDGQLFRARLMELRAGSASMTAFEEMGMVEKGPEILLMQALPERERMETIIQKATELGVSTILPFKSEKSISLGELDLRQKRSHNWGEIARKAAKQSRRLDIPEVKAYRSFEEALTEANSSGLKLLLWEGAKIELKDLLKRTALPIASAAILTGPEGGFSAQEIKVAIESGFIGVSLGSRVLRTETAAIFATGLLRYELGG